MIAVSIKNLKQGMVPAKDVTDQTGRLILASGNRITTRHIKTFKAWGITEVTVDDGRADPLKASQQVGLETIEIPEELKQEMDELFRYTDRNHPVIRELYDLCLIRKMGSLEEKADEA